MHGFYEEHLPDSNVCRRSIHSHDFKKRYHPNISMFF